MPCRSCKQHVLSLNVFLLCLLCIQGLKAQTEDGTVQQRALLDNISNGEHMQAILGGYFTNSRLEEHMRNFTSVERCGNVSRMFSIGKSTKGAELWALEISTNPGQEEAKPSFKYVANMHGDEPTGRVLTLAYAEWLCANWRTDPQAKKIVEGMKTFLLPTVNPDGFAAKMRGNSAFVDLNRDFPDPMLLGYNNLSATGTEQPETLAMMRWKQSTHFVASASMHEGAFVANYPWDGSEDRKTHYSASPDDKTFILLANSYASLHPQMNASAEFKGGITNGAAWYPLWGGMQDWSYVAADCLELTLELSQNKYPPPASLPQIWEDNRRSMINFPLTAVFGGLRGFVRASQGGDAGKRRGRSALKAEDAQPVAATISVQGIAHNTTSTSRFGDYYRPLAPGTYTVTASAPGFAPKTASVEVPANGSGAVLDFLLNASAQEGQAGKSSTPQNYSRLPRKFGAFSDGGDGIIPLHSELQDQDLLISESLWINMMQTAIFYCLGLGAAVLVVMVLRSVLVRGHTTHTSFRSMLRR